MYSQICAYMNSKFWMDQEGVYQGYNIKHTHTQYKFANIIVSLINTPSYTILQTRVVVTSSNKPNDRCHWFLGLCHLVQ